MTMEDTAPSIAIGLVEAVLTTAHAPDLMAGQETHVPALHFVGELVPFTQDTAWIKEIAAGFLPTDYSGDTLARCLFEIVSMALRRFDEVEPPSTFRMADAAQGLIAAEPATGLPSGTFCAPLRRAFGT
jgi:hypothetical protein